jgi:hypothetical protein
LTNANRRNVVAKAPAIGSRAPPSWISSFATLFGPDKTNGTYMQYTFLKTGDCVSSGSSYISDSQDNMCYGAYGVARAQLTTEVDEKAFSRVTSWNGDIYMTLAGTIFGTTVDILTYQVVAGAG